MLVALGLAVVLVFSRFYDIGADPTNYFTASSQALTTDPGHLTWHARNAVLFHVWNLFGYEGLQVFRWSAVSGVSYVLFKLFGVTRAVSNVTGAILNLSALLVFLIALRRHFSTRVLWVTSVFITFNFILTVYGRIAFTENGMLLFGALVFLVYSFWFTRWWGQLAVGLLIGLAAMVGKTFGLLLVFPAVAGVWPSLERRRWRAVALVVAGVVVAPLVFELTVGSQQGFFDLISAYLTRGHGMPVGFESVRRLIIGFVTVGIGSRFFQLTPILSVLLFLFSFRFVAGSKLDDARNPGVVFLFVWVWSYLVCLAPFNYLPLRYFFPLILPMAVLASVMIERWSFATSTGAREDSRPSWWRLVLLGVLSWLFMFYITVQFLDPLRMSDYYPYVWFTLPGALIVPAAWWWFIRPHRIAMTRQFATVATAVVLVLVVGFFGYETYRSRALTTYSIRNTNTDLSKILGPDAVVSGPYGPALSMNTRLRNLPFYEGDVQTAEENAQRMALMFGQYPVTHVALTEDEWQALTKAEPALRAAPLVARYWIRDVTVYIVRVAGVYGNTVAAQYQPTLYERAVDFRIAGERDSSWAAINAFVGSTRIASRVSWSNTTWR